MAGETTRVPALARRRLLGGLGAFVAVAALPAAPALAHARRAAPRTLPFRSLHTGERLKATYWADGAYRPEALAQLNWLMRDWRTGDVREIDPRLFDLLHRLYGRLESSGAFEIISAYRSPKTNNRLASKNRGVVKGSLHVHGQAIDISLSDRDLRQLHKAARSLRLGGVGYYPKSGFIHVDTGRVRFWGS